VTATAEQLGVLAMPRISDQLDAEYGPRVRAAELAVIEAQAAVADAMGDWA
jgi:hypothetical protein